MNLGVLILLLLVYGVLFLMIQRAEASRRILVIIILLPIGGLVYWFAGARGFHSENPAALVLALAMNLLFWFIIGRYNPVGSSDDIHVMGLDD